MRSLLIYLLFVCLFNVNLQGQNVPGDSAVKTINLGEVCISVDGDDEKQSFDFFRNSKLANTEDILSRMQGVNLIRRGAYGLEPTLRSYGSGQSNLTIDGMRIYGACTDKMDPASIYLEPINLSAIQVNHGASGALNGSTIGGQINMQVKEPGFNCHNTIKGQISQSYLSINNAYFANAAVEQSWNKISYRVNGTYRKANNYKAANNKTIPYSGYEKLNAGAIIMAKLSSAQTLKLDYLGDWGKNIGYPALPMDVGSATAQIISLTHKTTFTKKYFSTNDVKFYYNEVTHFMDDTHRPDAPMHMDMPGWTKTSGVYNELRASEQLKIRLDYHNVYARADMIMYPVNEPIMYMQTLPENYLNNAGMSVQFKQKFKHHQLITFNTRLDYYLQSASRGPGYHQWKVFNENITKEKTDFLKNASIAYSINFLRKMFAQLSAGYGERIPTSNERYGYYLYNRQDQYDYVGNLKLNPEQSYQTELTLKYQTSKSQFGINLFYHHINHYIYAVKLDGMSQMTIGAYGLKTYKNIPFAVTKGFEINANTEIINNLYYVGSIKFIYAETYDKKPLPLIAPLKLQHAIRYKLGLFTFQAEHDYAAEQKRVNSDYGDKVTPEYHLFNVRASKNFIIKNKVLQLTLACENLFDTSYREHLDIGQIPRFGRNFMINLNFLF